MLVQEKLIITINTRNLCAVTRRIVIIGTNKLEILDEQVLYSKGCFKMVRRWFKGAHPGLGIIIEGLTGWETVVDYEVIVPMIKIHIVD